MKDSDCRRCPNLVFRPTVYIDCPECCCDGYFYNDDYEWTECKNCDRGKIVYEDADYFCTDCIKNRERITSHNNTMHNAFKKAMNNYIQH